MGSQIERLRREGAEDKEIEVAINLLRGGKLTVEEISEAVGLTCEKVEELARDKAV